MRYVKFAQQAAVPRARQCSRNGFTGKQNINPIHFVHEDDHHRPLTAEAQFRFVASSYDICGR